MLITYHNSKCHDDVHLISSLLFLRSSFSDTIIGLDPPHSALSWCQNLSLLNGTSKFHLSAARSPGNSRNHNTSVVDLEVPSIGYTTSLQAPTRPCSLLKCQTRPQRCRWRSWPFSREMDGRSRGKPASLRGSSGSAKEDSPTRGKAKRQQIAVACNACRRRKTKVCLRWWSSATEGRCSFEGPTD